MTIVNVQTLSNQKSLASSKTFSKELEAMRDRELNLLLVKNKSIMLPL